MKAYLLIISVSLLLFASCESNKPVEYEYVEARMSLCDFDCCGGWIIEVGTAGYYPENLPKEFQVEDLEVLLAFDKTEERKGCGFAGSMRIIKILDIKRL